MGPVIDLDVAHHERALRQVPADAGEAGAAKVALVALAPCELDASGEDGAATNGGPRRAELNPIRVDLSRAEGFADPSI